MSLLYTPSPIQQEFHLCPADEILFAGSAGPGKSLALLMDPIQTQLVYEHERVKRRDIHRSTGWAIHFRREFPMLAQTLDRAHTYFPKIDPKVHWNGDAYTFTFSCGYKFQFAHLKNPKDWQNYDSNQYCVARGTPILMADGTYVAIEDIHVGAQVMTLEGPKRVSGVALPRHTHCVRADVYLGHEFVGTQLQPTTHPLLTSAAGSLRWSSGWCRSASPAPRTLRTWQDYESLLFGRQESPATRASAADEGSGFVEFAGVRRAASLLPQLSVPVVLHGPAVRRAVGPQRFATLFPGADTGPAPSATTGQADALPPSGSPEGQLPTVALAPRAERRSPEPWPDDGACEMPGQGTDGDSPAGCPPGLRSRDGRPLCSSDTDRETAPSPGDAASRTRSDWTPDAAGSAQGCIPADGGWSYLNFYSRETRPVSEEIVLGTCVLTPAGVHEVFDISVEDANHYIGESGLVSLNTHLAFDELRQFEEEQYIRLATRVRSSDPELQKRKRIVSCTNPDPGWVRQRFIEPAPQGKKLLVTKVPLDDGTIAERTRIFIPATLKDNPDAAFRRDYELQLQDKPEHIRKSLLYGDWFVVAGAFFATEWYPNIHVCEPFQLPTGWKRFRSSDWGYKSPGCVHWWAVDTEGNLTCYREYTFQNTYVDDVAKQIREFERADGTWDEKSDISKLTGPLDTQAWEQRGQKGPSMAEVFASKGVYWEKCEKNKLASVQQLIRRLRQRSKLRAGDDGVPGIRFFKTCRKAITTIPSIGTDDKNAELPADGGEDHWLDSALYACAYRTIAADSDIGPQRRDDEDELLDRRRLKRGRYGYGGF